MALREEQSAGLVMFGKVIIYSMSWISGIKSLMVTSSHFLVWHSDL
jgi:hypothetical protein